MVGGALKRGKLQCSKCLGCAFVGSLYHASSRMTFLRPRRLISPRTTVASRHPTNSQKKDRGGGEGTTVRIVPSIRHPVGGTGDTLRAGEGGLDRQARGSPFSRAQADVT